MKEIDFLPRSYHRATARRRQWRRSLMLSLIIFSAGLTALGGRLLWNHRVPREAEAKQDSSLTRPAAADAGRATFTRANADGSIGRAAAGLTLQGTQAGARPLATINGRIVGLGEAVEGFVVESIEPARVTVRRGTARVTLETGR